VKTIIRCCLAILVLAFAGPVAQAQMVDDAELRADGAAAVLVVRFATPVQLLRSSSAQRGELVQVFYGVLPARNLPSPVPSERRITAFGLPQMIVADDGVGQAGQGRRLTIRFAPAARIQVRPGKDNRSIEVVLEGLGAALRAASRIPPLPLADATRRYVVAIQSSDDPNIQLDAPIPAAMQDFDVFSSRRVIDGKTLFDLNLGYFATQLDAERARNVLLRRFPKATVVALPLLPSEQAPVARAVPLAPPAPASPTLAPVPAPPTSASPLGLALPAMPAVPVPLPSAVGVPRPGLAGTAASPPAPAAAPAPPRAPAPAAPGAPAAGQAIAPPPALAASAPAPAGAPDTGPIATAEQVNAQAAALMRRAQEAFDKADYPASIEALNGVLALPPNPASRRAQDLIATTRLRQGDTVRARAELELFLRLYPQGADSDRVRQALATLPAAAPAGAAARPRPPVQPTTTLNASLAQYYFGGKSKTRTQDFQDSPIAGLPPTLSENTVSDTDQSQLQSNADVSWRHRDAEHDLRFVFRDSYSHDLLRPDKSKNRLSALYVDHRLLSLGTNLRVGRQSPSGGGALYRFDGVQAGYSFAPKWRVNGVFGIPSEKLLDTKRSFYGASIDAEALTDQISGSVFGTQQIIDDQIDRRAVGAELRFFSGGISASAQLDYDVLIKALNVAAFQGTWQFAEGTIVNTLYDRRAVAPLTLGNLLFFSTAICAPALAGPPSPATRVTALLQECTLERLRREVKEVTAYQQQALLGVTTPITKQWQWGADVRLANIGPVPPVPTLEFPGSPSTGKQWSLSTQFIGSNLYSGRDSHVLSLTYLTGPTMDAHLISYNNLSSFDTFWQVEPSLRYYSQKDMNGTRSQRWTPGLRLTLRPLPTVSLESDLSYERSKTESEIPATPSTPRSTNTQTANRIFYFVGLRYDF
jgi:hypothetical protein